MGYPIDLPAENIDDIWVSGNYTPDDIVIRIKDNVSPIDKNTMRNSVGYQISLLQNYINSINCGYSNLPITDGYFDRITASGSSDYFRVEYNVGDVFRRTQSNYDRVESILSEISPLRTQNVKMYPDRLQGSWLTDTQTHNFELSTVSGFTMQFQVDAVAKRTIDISPFSGIIWTYTDLVDAPQHNIYMRVDAQNSGLYMSGVGQFQPTDESSTIERIHTLSGTMSISTTTSQELTIPNVTANQDVQLLSFYVSTTGESNEAWNSWIPSNYYPQQAAIDLAQFFPSGSYGTHIRKHIGNDQWYVTITPMETGLYNNLINGNSGTSCFYKYSYIVYS